MRKMLDVTEKYVSHVIYEKKKVGVLPWCDVMHFFIPFLYIIILTYKV